MAVDKAMMDEMNLSIMKRRDPDVEQILGASAHVTMYIMSVETQKWERRNVEGTLFVLKRRTNPRFQMMVLNKLNTENYLETIESGFHAEVSPPYLIYTQGGGKVHAIWFYEEGDLNRIANLLIKVESGLPRNATPLPVQEVVDKAEGNDDQAFWDKPVKQGQQPGGPGQAPAPPGTNAITNLFKNMQIKQQQQATGPPGTPPAAGPPGGPLPPAFFLGQQQQAAAPAPPPVPAPAAAPRAPPASVMSTDLDHPINKLFNNRQASGALPPPAAAAPPQPSALTALFNAASRQGSMQLPQPSPQAPPPAVNNNHNAYGAPPPGAQEDKLRLALGRLVHRQDFINILAEELRGVGILQ